MDWPALFLSLRLAALSALVLLPVSVLGGWALGRARFRGKGLIEALIMLPLVLPPTVLGFYLLIAFGADAPLGALWHRLTGGALVFSFSGLLAASALFNLPFAIQPAQRAFAAIPEPLREAAACAGLGPWARLWRIELPLALPGVLGALVLCFAHTLGEFGVVLMVGGAIPGETRTIAIAIYDRVQAFDMASAGRMSALLVAISLLSIALVFRLTARHERGLRG